MTTFTQNLKSIQEAYEGIVSEGNEPKFKVGDKVGIGSFMSSAGYQPRDTGTVSKVNKHGHHTVDYDNFKSMDDSTKPKQEVFNHAGVSRADNFSRIIPLVQHDARLAEIKDRHDRTHAMNHIIQTIAGNGTHSGAFSKIDPVTADHLKSLIDMHTNKE